MLNIHNLNYWTFFVILSQARYREKCDALHKSESNPKQKGIINILNYNLNRFQIWTISMLSQRYKSAEVDRRYDQSAVTITK